MGINFSMEKFMKRSGAALKGRVASLRLGESQEVGSDRGKLTAKGIEPDKFFWGKIYETQRSCSQKRQLALL